MRAQQLCQLKSIKCSLKELFRRDTKKLYIRAKKNIIKNLIGYNSTVKYEKSRYKKITVDTEILSLSQSVNKVYKKIIVHAFAKK